MKLVNFIYLFIFVCSVHSYGQLNTNFPQTYFNENQIIEIVEGKNDSIYVFLNTGYYKVENSSDINNSTFNLENKVETSLIQRVMPQGDSIIWIYGNGTLYQFENEVMVDINFPDDGVMDVKVDSQNILWVATWGSGLYRYNNNRWENFNKTNDNLVDNRVTALDIDRDGKLWIGYHMYGIGYVEGDEVHNIEVDELADEPFDVSKILIAGDTIFVAGWDGLYIYSETKLRRIYESSSVEDLALDANDTLWMTSYNDGLCKINIHDIPEGGGFELDVSNYEKVGDPNIPVFLGSILIDSQAKMWLSSSQGICHYNNEWYLYSKPCLTDNRIQSIKFHGSQIWVCTYRGLSLYQNGRWFNFDHELIKDKLIYDLMIDENNDIWVCTSDYLLNYSFDNATKELSLVDTHDFGHSHQFITSNNDTKYVGTWGSGVAIENGSGWDMITEDDGLVSNYAKDIVFQGDIVWITSLYGITKIENNVVTSYLTKTDLPVNYVYGGEVSDDGEIWFGCDGGLLKYDGNAFQFYAHGSQYAYYYYIEKAAEGKLWVGARSGAYIYDIATNSLELISEDWHSDEVRSLSTDTEGHVWFGTGFGIRTNHTDCNENNIHQTITLCEGEFIYLEGAFQTESGTYYDKVETGNCCDVVLVTELSFWDCVPTSLSESKSESGLIFPNPVENWLTISYDGYVDKIQIFSSAGELVINQMGNQKRINVSEFAKGIYVIKVVGSDGIVAQQFVKY
ncbi:T9SS type A sorting domain-containing protein [Labilibacter sediminis]|nr:T9SS type A sorting domain-containing protein [Labilibacter sediminis]